MHDRIRLIGWTTALLVTGTAGCAAELHSDAALADDVTSQESYLTVTKDFTVGIQVSDACQQIPGDWQHTAQLETANPTVTSDWACNGRGNCFDPDAARVELDMMDNDDVRGRDFRICLQASDGQFSHTQQVAKSRTPWASAGGGPSGQATDSNRTDPDSYRISIDTRAWPNDVADKEAQFRLRLRAWDRGSAFTFSTFTNWSHLGGGVSGWASSNQCFDPDGYEIDMQVNLVPVESHCSVATKCQRGFGDCDTNTECVAGLICRQNVGNQFGYTDNSIDVCD